MATLPKDLYKIEAPKNNNRHTLSWAVVRDGFIYKTDANSMVRLKLTEYGFSTEAADILENTAWPLSVLVALNNKEVEVLDDGRLISRKHSRVCYPSRLDALEVTVFDHLTGEAVTGANFRLPDMFGVWAASFDPEIPTPHETNIINLEKLVRVSATFPKSDHVKVTFNKSCMKLKPKGDFGEYYESTALVMLKADDKDFHPKF